MKTNLLIIAATFVVINLLTQGPNLVKFFTRPPDGWYGGHVSWFDPWDVNFYSSVIGFGRRDGLLYENLYDTAAHPAMPIYTLYTLTGKIASSLPLSNVFLFNLLAVAASLPLIFVLWWFTGIFLPEGKLKRLAFVLLCIGGGLGWLFYPGNLLADIGQPGFTLANAFQRPHEAVSLMLLLGSIGQFWFALVNRRKISYLLGGLWFFLMLFFHPYNAFIVGVIFAVFGVWNFIKTKSYDFLKVLLIVVSEGGIYYLLVGKNLLANPVFAGLVVSQIQSSPPIFHSILGWGLLLPLLLTTLWQKKKNNLIIFLLGWFFSHWAATYLPLGFQRSLARGLWVPVALLAVLALPKVAAKLKLDFRLAAVILILISGLSSFLMAEKRVTESAGNRWIYLTQAEGEAINYLVQHGTDEEGVLASYRIANILPAHTSQRVWVGHEFETPNAQERLALVERFYANKMGAAEIPGFLKKANVRWIFYGPDEKTYSQSPLNLPPDLVALRFQNGEVTLYEVN